MNSSPDTDSLGEVLPTGERQRGLPAFASIAVAGLGLQLLTVASGPLVARMLGPEGRGQMVTITVVSILCSQLGMGGLPAAISHAVATAAAPARDVLRPHLRLWFLLSFAPAAASVGLAIAFLHGTAWLFALASAAFVVTLFTNWLLLMAAMLQGEGNVRHVNALRVSGSMTYVGLIVAIFVVHRTDIAVVLLFVYAAAQLVALGVGMVRLQKPTGDDSVQVPRVEVHRFARHSWVSGVGALDGLGMDHLLVGVLLGQGSLGLYAVAVSVTNLPTIVLGGIAAILLPRMVAQPVRQSHEVMHRWIAAAIVLDLALVLGLQLVIGPAIRVVFGQEFVPATTCARILIVAWGFLALRRVLTAVVQAQGRAGLASRIEVVCSVVLVLGVVVGSSRSGIEGAGAAMGVAGALSCVWLAWAIRWRTQDEEVHPEVDVSEVAALDNPGLRLP